MKKNIRINDVISHIRDSVFMSGVERDGLRTKVTAEFFTPTSLVQLMLANFEQINPNAFKDLKIKVIDHSCGDGQFLGEVLIRKLQNGIDFKTALSTIYGVELMQDNVDLCRERLLCKQEHLRHIVEQNIVCADALTYDYSFKSIKERGSICPV